MTGDEDVKPFHVLLADAMKRQGVSVEELADAIDRDPSQVYKYLRGESKPRPPAVRRIAVYLKVSPVKMAQALLVDAADSEVDTLAKPTIAGLQRRILELEQELDKRRLEHGEPPFDIGNGRLPVDKRV